MIERIHLTNFKNHADTQIELGRLTALIGPNSSGKTNVLQALDFFGQLVSSPMHDVSKGERDTNFLVRNGKVSFCIELRGVSIPSDDFPEATSWFVSVEGTKHNPFKGARIAGQWGDERFDVNGDTAGQRSAWELSIVNVAPQGFRQAMGVVRYIKLVSKNLGEPSYSVDVPPRVELDGSRLASAVAYLKTYKEESFASVLKALQSIVPGIMNVRARPAPVRIKETQFFKIDDKVIPHDKEHDLMGHELVFDMAGAQEVPAHSVSEGTLLALALLTLLWSPDCPNLVLLDDIEQGLHPKAQRELIAQLRKILKQRPELQIVLTSHSPYIVDELEPKEVWLLATDDEGVAHARRLSDHPEADEWLKILSTGEFWDAEGEEWILEHGK